MKSSFNTWDELFSFIDSLCNKLDASNAPSVFLRDWRSTAWGSNLEMWGELGEAIKQTKQATFHYSESILHDLNILMREVRRTWHIM